MSGLQRSDRGQALLLLPAGFLVLLVLGSLVLEAASLHLHQRRLDDLADSIASDSVAVGFDREVFRESGAITVDPGRAQSVLAGTVATSQLSEVEVTGFRVIPGPNPAVELDLAMPHESIIGGALLGGAPDVLTATGRAELVLATP